MSRLLSQYNQSSIYHFQTSIKMKMLGQMVAKYLTEGELDVSMS